MKLIVLSALMAVAAASGRPDYQGNSVGVHGGFNSAGGAFGGSRIHAAGGGYSSPTFNSAGGAFGGSRFAAAGGGYSSPTFNSAGGALGGSRFTASGGGYSSPTFNSAGGAFGGSRITAAGGGSGGGSYDSQDYHTNPDYSYGYSVKDPYSGVDIDAQENRYGYQTQGSYGTTLPDGRRQNVNYVVDKDSGFQADVEYYGVARHPRTPINKGYGQGSHANLHAGAVHGSVQHGAIYGGVQHGAIHGGVQHGAIHSGVQHGTIHGGVQHGAIRGGVQHDPVHSGVSYRGGAGFSGSGVSGAGFSGAGFTGASFGRSGFPSGSSGGYGGCRGYTC